MRVRYGKPIKVRSLLGKANIPFSYTAANVTFYPLTTGTFHSYAGPSVLNIKYVNRQANHKYFLFLNTDIVYSWSYFGIWDTYNTGYEGNRTAPIKDGNNYYALISPTTSATNGVPSFQFGVTQNLPAIANYALIIDLTEIGLDNLTAQEFYNKYNKYFPLIATGEEITIDDKAGQVSLKEKNSNNTISCKVAGGSSDIYYGYNQLSPLWTTDIYNGVTASIKNNGKDIELSGTATGLYIKDKNLGQTIPSGHEVLVMSEMTNPTGANFGYRLRYNSDTPIYSNNEFNKIHTLTGNINKFQLYADLGDDCTGIKLNNLVIIDLTDWFGPGNEPATVKEFKEKFAKEYYGTCLTPIKLTRYQIEALPSYGYNQLIKNGNFTDSSNWNVTENAQRRPSINNNIYTIETLTQGYSVSVEQLNNAQFLYSNHKYLVHFEARGTSAGPSTHLQASIKLYSYANSATIFNQPYQELTNEFKDFYSIITPTQTTSGTSASGGFRIYYGSNTGLSYVGDKVQMKNIYIIDLTDWYGEGKEPATIEEFKQTFPNKYYAYSKKRLLNKYMINKLEN